MKPFLLLVALGAAIVWTSAAFAAPVLSPNDFIIAIDTDPFRSHSAYPVTPNLESPFNVSDGTVAKYLNFAEINTGFMATPFSGPSTIQSMVITTANDAVERDPTSWAVYGTNENIDLAAPGVDNGDSLIANWQLISQGSVALPAARNTLGPVLSFANTTAYAHYRVVFPTVSNASANSMQVAEVGLFPTADGTGTSVLGILDATAAFQLPSPDSRFNPAERPALVLDGSGPLPGQQPTSNFPANEGPANVVDGTNNKYLNFGEVNSGFIVTPASGPSQVQSFTLTSANDAPERDPAAWSLFGTNSPITSVSNSFGTAEPWTLIGSGAVTMPDARNTLGPAIQVTNPTSYASYKMLFTGVRDAPAANSMQLAEASFFASVDGSGTDILNAGDPVIAIDATVQTGLDTKYLNLGRENSGIIITPTAGAKAVTSFEITTANDNVARDPATYAIYGTNAPIASTQDSRGDGEAWTLISSGDLNLPAERFTAGTAITFANTTSYTSYRLVFPTIKDALAVGADSMQIASLQFFDSSVVQDVDLDNDGDIDGNDFLLIQRTDTSLIAAWRTQFGTVPSTANAGSVPEPSAALLALAAAGWLSVRRREAQ